MRAPPRLKATRQMSWMAAPVGLVTTPTMRGSVGMARFRSGAKRPSAPSLALRRSRASEARRAPRLDEFGHELQPAAGSPERGAPPEPHSRAVDAEGPHARGDVGLVDDDVDRGLLLLVLEAEVEVPARRGARPGNLALHPHGARERVVERALDGAVELRHAEHARLGRRRRRRGRRARGEVEREGPLVVHGAIGAPLVARLKGRARRGPLYGALVVG